jgi:hypothetical protein
MPMRLVIFVTAVSATGALSASAMQTMFPQTEQTFAAVRALGGDPRDFKIPEINPVKAYWEVVRQITSGRPAQNPSPYPRNIQGWHGARP